MHRHTGRGSPAIRAEKGWRGRRELAPRCSATQLAARRHDPGQTRRVLNHLNHTHHTQRTTHNTQHTTQHTPHHTPHHTTPRSVPFRSVLKGIKLHAFEYRWQAVVRLGPTGPVTSLEPWINWIPPDLHGFFYVGYGHFSSS